MEGTFKRLYVGGIGPSVTKAELTERFGKFGKVDDVDIISRKDEQGNPIKTFAYININVSDAELKKCMSLLNKTKWKGGQIQIEMAKESFLDRLSQERQKAKEKEEAKSRRRSQTDLVQSLEKAGVTDFQMKSAVPGTEVPNHKNWVVSKFGRVLPVLHLNGSKQSKSMKYDPSKFCHNIKKIDDDSFETVPVSNLTWQLEGGDDEISKKRRGEFPAFKSPPKKASKFSDKGDVSNRKMSTRVPSAFVPQSGYESQNARKPQQTKIRGHLVTKSINSMSDEEYDSEEELQAVLQRERARMGSVDHAEDSNVEVVDDSFELSYTTHWGKLDTKAQKPDLSTQGDKEYDSADTDEIITVAKTTQDDCRSDRKKKATVVKNNNSSLKVHNKKQASTVGLGAKSLHKPKATVSGSESDNESSAAESSDSISDEEYDSEKELQAVLQREKARTGSVDHAEDSNVEVVDDSFELSYTTHWGKRDAKAQKPDFSTQGDKEYDSADTDEIITVAKTTQDDCRSDKKKKGTVLKNDNSLNIHNKKQAPTVGLGAKSLHKPQATVLESESDNESSASGAESSDSFSDEEYEAMMQNCYRLDLSMGDLEAMSKEAAERDSDNISEDEEYESESDSANTSPFTKRTSPKPDKCSPDNSAKEQKPNHKLISEAVKGKQKAKTLHRGEFNGRSEKVETDDSDSDSCQQMDSTKPKSCGNNVQIKMLKAKSATPKPSLVKDRKQEDVSEDEEGEKNGKKEGPGSQKIKKDTKQRGIEPDDTVASILEDGDSEEEEGKPKKRAVKPSLVKDHIKENISEDETVDNKKKKDPGSQPVKNITKKRGIEPDDIVASILEDSGSDDERPKHKRKKGPPVNLPAFKGLGSLMASSSPSSSSLSAKFCGQATPVSEASSEGNSNKRTSGDTKKGKSEEPCRDLRKKLPEAKQETTSSSDTSSEDDSSTDSSPTISPAGKSCATPTVPIKDQPASEAKQKKDNQKRLAAMEERRKERELQKQTIQGALLKMESQASKKTQHIVFSSESGTESEKEEEKPTSETKVLPNDSKAKQGAAKLFDSSEEDSGSEDEKNDERFEIKAQYEGRSGEKLMRLQSRFGTDERFKMDSRFLESSSDDEDASEEAQKSPGDAEDDLSAEKKKNLSILQSIMNVNVETRPTSKRAEKAKKFKDLNALHYDPTKEDHEEFETKPEEKKESKSERKKKRLEAEKLPEVSKDTYHEINVDLKEVFSTFKPQGAEQAEVTWDQQLEPEEEEEDTSDKDFSFQNQAEEPAGFTFSFFGNNEEENVPSNEPYKTETIKPAKVVWQEDPRFQDSSSGEDEEEEDTSMAVEEKPSAQPATSSIRFFFFVKDDERLKTGPKTFCRSSITEPEDWEQRRDSLLEECRKRHKDAKRKMKTKH